MKEKQEQTNPFLTSLSIPCYYSSFNKGKDDKSIQKSVTFTLRESSPYTSVYHEYLLPVMKLLTGSGPSIVFYIISKLGQSSEKIELNPIKVCEACDISYATYKRGLEQLKGLSIIVKANRKNIYWINPNLFFRGSRINAFPNNLEIPQSPIPNS
jgi:hypothetical protein